jgi:D-arabinose 1-dehydrogenase-like Zn-dependent alcohol dehydrogenase
MLQVQKEEKSMKGRVAVLTGPKEIALKEFEIPSAQEGAILLEVLKANVCGSDLHIWRGLHPVIKKGVVLGHEFIGRIKQLGKGVNTDYAGSPVSPGDRVVAPYFLTCLKCPPCLRGDFSLCQNAYKFTAAPPETPPQFHGSYATHYYVHPNQYFYKVPDALPDAVAAGANCGLSQVFYGLDKASLSMGETVVIQGAGGLGLHASAVAKEKGARVIMIEGAPERLKFAKAFGADHLIDLKEIPQIEHRVEHVRKITGTDGADVVLEVSGVPSAFLEALYLARTGGRVVGIGNILIGPEFEVSIPPGLITRKGISVQGIVRYSPWYLYRSLQFLEQNHRKYPYEKFSDREYSLGEAKEALERSESRSIARAIIVPE